MYIIEKYFESVKFWTQIVVKIFHSLFFCKRSISFSLKAVVSLTILNKIVWTIGMVKVCVLIFNSNVQRDVFLYYNRYLSWTNNTLNIVVSVFQENWFTLSNYVSIMKRFVFLWWKRFEKCIKIELKYSRMSVWKIISLMNIFIVFPYRIN